MKFLSLFSGHNKKNIFNLSSAEFEHAEIDAKVYVQQRLEMKDYRNT